MARWICHGREDAVGPVSREVTGAPSIARHEGEQSSRAMPGVPVATFGSDSTTPMRGCAMPRSELGSFRQMIGADVRLPKRVDPRLTSLLG